MADLTLKLEVSEYRCEPCTQQQGTVVRELVQMIPKSVVVFGKLVGPAYWCCPICFEPKFDAKTRKPVSAKRPVEPDASGHQRRSGKNQIRVIK
ncbi:hypothetical protein [Bradyrhizobium sp. DASA03007]|uniref:hypothetical protein n=1 Tax=unclassified Bradyrhizobium TaxID=2631580 RepID=UPI003F70C3B5